MIPFSYLMKIENATISNSHSLRSTLRIEANASSYEIELLFNRAKGKTVDTSFEASGDITRFGALSPTCEQCKSNLLEFIKKQLYLNYPLSETQLNLSVFFLYMFKGNQLIRER